MNIEYQFSWFKKKNLKQCVINIEYWGMTEEKGYFSKVCKLSSASVKYPVTECAGLNEL